MKTRRRQDSSYVRVPHFQSFSTSFQRHIVLLEIVALANSKKNRNIKANDVNLISMARSIFVLQINRTLLSMFCRWSVTLWKILSHDPPPPPPRNFQWSPVEGVWIFSGTTQVLSSCIFINFREMINQLLFDCYPIHVVLIIVFIYWTCWG